MTEREAFDFVEHILSLAAEQSYRCAVCHDLLTFSNAQWAHRISQSKANIKKYGKRVIHHRLNGAVVCSLRCNHEASIENQPIARERLVAQIQEELSEETPA